MKLGLLSAILPNQTFEEVIDIAKANHLQAVEVACWPSVGEKRRYAGVSHITPEELTEKRVNEILGYCKKQGISISSLGYYPNPLSPDSEVSKIAIAHLYKLIDASKKLKVNMITTFIGRDPRKNLEESFKDFEKVWPEIIKYAEERKVRVAIENCPMLFSIDEWPGGKNLATNPNNFRRMFSIIKSDYFGLNFDPSHYVWQQMDYIKTIHEFKDKIFHVHLKDLRVFKDRLDEVGVLALPLEYMAPKIPGRGDIDWKKFFDALNQVHYNGACVLEIEDKDYEGSHEKVLESIWLSIQEVKKYI